MDPTFRHRRSPSSDRFLGISSSTSTTSEVNDDELNEDDILWTSDDSTESSTFTTSTRASATPTAVFSPVKNHNRLQSFTQGSGILAALPEHDNRPVLYRKSSVSSSTSSTSAKMIPTLPKPPQMERSQSMPMRKYQHSAPMNVPVLSIAIAKRRNSRFLELDEEDGDDEMLPPHEIVARGSGMSPKTTFSVLEGVGRTLKGRDLRQVRNAVFRQTGFLD
ncbi:uncharacterized protein LOC123221967 [Mangifera indica]|uniref:uncharacterized protein LOC123221967 n=1 Tax=Mangifera indica TaxID=29780 RepID=UPI001CFC03CF|nr:uncharacterized protein LOC123221967 [Mangifera indica]